MTNNFAKIFFMPVCSNCMKLLDMDIKYRELGVDYPAISPQVCPHCGNLFEEIIVPNVTNGSIFHYDKTIYEPYSEINKGDYI